MTVPGGVTFTGGETACPTRFFIGSAQGVQKGKGSIPPVDTSLYASPQVVSEIIPIYRLFLADLKIMDPLLHRKFTGVDNTLIHENLRHVACSGVPFMIRIPFIHGINNDGSGIDAMVRFILELRDSGNLQGIHLLPYHNFGTDKKKRIISGKVLFQRSFSTPQKESIDSLFLKFQSLGIVTMIGG